MELADAHRYLKKNGNSFDVVLAIDLIGHFTKDEIFELFIDMHYALKRKGRLIIQTPNGQGIFSDQVIYDDFTHLTIFNTKSLVQVLKWTGFRNFEFYKTNPVLKDLKGMTRFCCWQIIKCIVNIIRTIEAGKTDRILTENLICKCSKP